MHVFPFSSHTQTKASKLKGQVSEKVKKERSFVLRTLSDKQNCLNTKKMIKSLKEFDVIIENKDKDYYFGRSEYYFSLKFKINKKEIKLKKGDLVCLKKSEIDIV